MRVAVHGEGPGLIPEPLRTGKVWPSTRARTVIEWPERPIAEVARDSVTNSEKPTNYVAVQRQRNSVAE